MKRYAHCLAVLAFVLAALNSYGQSTTISGKVASEDWIPLSDVTITAKSASKKSVSDRSGKFTLTLPTDTDTLFIEAPGYESKSIALEAGRKDVYVILKKGTPVIFRDSTVP